MKPVARHVFGILLALTAQAQAATITVSSADQQKLGISTTGLAEAHNRESSPAYVKVLDPAALAALDADLTAARAAASASATNADRLARLAAEDESASRQAAEAAAAQAVGDVARADALARRMSVEWAPALEQMPAERRAALIRQLTDGTAVLLRADTLAPIDDRTAEVSITEGSGTARIVGSLGPAGAMDPRMQTFGTLAVLRDANLSALPPGLIVDGRVYHGGQQAGVVIPRTAVVRLEGADWAYLRTGSESFERREISGPIATADGWFITHGFAPGDDVVIEGAGTLLAIERADEDAEAN